MARATQAHLDARGVAAQVVPAGNALLPSCHVRRHAVDLTTTIVIPARGGDGDDVRACIDSLMAGVRRTTGDILVVSANGCVPQRRLATLGTTIRIVEAGLQPLAVLLTMGARAARSACVCFVDASLRASDATWLEEMLGRLADPGTGAVGALTYWPSGIVEHAGLIVGPEAGVGRPFIERTIGDPGYADLLKVAHECSAVSWSCMATRRQAFFADGGFDAASFPHHLGDVDYCLALRRLGMRIVLTPHAKLTRNTPTRLGVAIGEPSADTWARELRTLRTKWGPAFVRGDPFDNPHFALDGAPYSALACPPWPKEPRTQLPPQPCDVVPGM